jgi:hypothetical protein
MDVGMSFVTVEDSKLHQILRVTQLAVPHLHG